MTKLHLVNCNLHWGTLVYLVQNLPYLNNFTDTWCCHFQYYTYASCRRVNCGQGSLSKLYDKLSLNDLKCKNGRLRIFRLSRKSMTKELCVYFQIIQRIFPYLEDFEFNLGPWETPRQQVSVRSAVLDVFGKSFQGAMARARKTLKRLSLNWHDENLSGLFDKCVDAIHAVEFPRLCELSLKMSDKSMRTPEKLPQFLRFLNSFEWREEGSKITRQDKILLKAYVCPIFMTKDWVDFLFTFQDRIMRRKSRVSLRIGVKTDDSVTKLAEKSIMTDVFRNYLFYRGLTRLQVHFSFCFLLLLVMKRNPFITQSYTKTETKAT